MPFQRCLQNQSYTSELIYLLLLSLFFRKLIFAKWTAKAGRGELLTVVFPPFNKMWQFSLSPMICSQKTCMNDTMCRLVISFYNSAELAFFFYKKKDIKWFRQFFFFFCLNWTIFIVDILNNHSRTAVINNTIFLLYI